MKITILTDNPNSWIIPYVEDLKQELNDHDVLHIFDKKDIRKGDILFLLSCEKIITQDYLKLNTNNIVVHPSPLPKYKGWSPMAYQILDGVREIVVSLFEAKEEVDEGNIYLQKTILLDGTELNKDIKEKQGSMTVVMVREYINKRDTLGGVPQVGEGFFCKKRTANSSEISPSDSIIDQFDQFRVADNDRYPVFFRLHGKKYILKIYEED